MFRKKKEEENKKEKKKKKNRKFLPNILVTHAKKLPFCLGGIDTRAPQFNQPNDIFFYITFEGLLLYTTSSLPHSTMKFTRVLRQAEEVLVKAAEGYPTGLAGLYQHPNPRPALISLYNYTLNYLQKNFPEHSVYRQSVEAMTKSRLKIVEENEIKEVIENKIGGGLIEEIVVQANDELALAKDLSSLKAWEELEEKPLDDQWVYFGKKINE